MTKPDHDMIINKLPIDFTYTEELRSDLLSHVHSLKTRYSLILDLDLKENSLQPYLKNYSEERERMMELQDHFSDECRDNYMGIDDKRMAERYCKLLREYFDFLAGAKEMLKKNKDRFYQEIIGEQKEDEDIYTKWMDENENTYFVSLLYWTAFLEDEYFDIVQETINEYDSRLIEFWKLNIVTVSDAAALLNQKPESTELQQEDEDLKVKLLIAKQSGFLNGEIHRLTEGQQQAVLGVLFGRSSKTVKPALTALNGNTDSQQNPRNLPKVVDKANNLIIEKELGLPLIQNRKDR